MASAIDTKITLSGLEEARAKLGEIGSTGEKAMGQVNASVTAASEGTSKFTSAIEELGEKLGVPVDSIEKIGATLGHLDFAGGIGGLEALGAAIVAAGVAFLALGEHAANATRQIENQARTLGIGAEALEGLNFAAAGVGVAADSSSRAFDRLYVKIGAAREEQDKLLNGGKGFDSTKEIVEQIASVHGDFVDTLAAVADKFKAIEDPARRATLGMQLFGRGWGEVAPILELGAEGIRKYIAEWEALKISATEGEKQMAASYAAASNKLKLVTEGLTNAVGNIVGQLFTPGLNALAEALAGAQQRIRDFAQAVVDRLRPPLEAASHVVEGFVGALNDMTAIINRALGTDFSTTMVVATALLVSFARPLAVITGAFLLVEAAIKTVFGADSPIDAAKIAGYVAAFASLIYMVKSLAAAMQLLWLNPFGLILAGAVALGVVLVALLGDTKAISDAIRKYLGDDAASTFESFVGDVQGGWERVKTGFMSALGEMSSAFDSWLQHSQSTAAGILRLISRIASALGAAGGSSSNLAQGQAAMSPDFNAGDTSQQMARGGRVPGSGFGDIVPALLTPGEFVTRVAAVQHYGLGFMQRLNNLQIPRFNMGGFVDAAMEHFAPTQRFASGGLVEMAGTGGGRVAVDLTINGHTFSDMMAPAETAKNLVTFARGEVVRRAGRKPGWFA